MLKTSWRTRKSQRRMRNSRGAVTSLRMIVRNGKNFAEDDDVAKNKDIAEKENVAEDEDIAKNENFSQDNDVDTNEQTRATDEWTSGRADEG